MLYFGIDQLLQQHPAWKSARIGLVTNEAATTRELIPSRQALLHAGFQVTRLFSPEHGLDIRGADGHPMLDGKDDLTGLHVVSLYGERLAPETQHLDDLDILLFDVPDVGSRFYTYLWTLTHVMEAAAAFKKTLVILDRPNPVSGIMDLAEGPILNEQNSSFIGRWSIPVRHSATFGELALYFNAAKKIGADITVIRCSQWQRDMFQPDWGIPFVPTSPAIQSFTSMLLYPGLCLLEATNISEGRGSDLSFLAAGAPWLKANAVADMLNSISGEAYLASVTSFTPVHSKFKEENCRAVSLQVTDPVAFNPVMTGLLLIKLIKSLHLSHFSWAAYPTSVNPTGKKHLDKLSGISNSEDLFDLTIASFIATITRETRCKEWEKMIQPYLLYS